MTKKIPIFKKSKKNIVSLEFGHFWTLEIEHWDFCK